MGTIATRRLIAQATEAGEAVTARGKLSVAGKRTKKLRASDADLAKRFAAGEVEAAQQVIDRHQAALTAFIARMLGWQGDQLAADMVQEVFVKALIAREKFDGKATIKSWLTRIAINECRAHFRKQNRRDKLLRWWRAGLGQRTNPPPEQGIARSETDALVRQAINQLSHKLREVVVLHYLESMSVKQTAEVLDLNPAAVAVRLNRARAKLKTLLDHKIL